MTHTLLLTDAQLRLIVRSLRDQAVFHSHAAECEARSGFDEFSAEDREQAAELRGLADQLAIHLPVAEPRVA